MARKPAYEELEERVREFQKEATKRKLAEQALRESEEKFRTLFEASPDGILVTDIQTKKFKYANPALCKLLGYSEVEIRGLGISDVHPEDKLEYVISEFEAHVKGQITLAESIPFLRKDGTIVYVDISGTPVIIDGKNCSIGFLRDIMERRRAEEALRRAHDELEQRVEERTAELVEANNQLKEQIEERRRVEEAFRSSEREMTSILRNTPDIVYRLDRDGNITFISHAVEKYGYSREELLGREMLDFIHPEDRQKAKNRINERRAGDRRTKSLELRLLTGDQTTLHFESVAKGTEPDRVFLLEAEGLYGLERLHERTFGGTQGVLRDITDRKRAEREIDTRNKILRAFLAEFDQDMYDDVLKTVLSAFESEFGVVGHIDKEGNLVCPSMTSHVWNQCRMPDKRIVFPKHTWGDSIWGNGLRTGKSDYSNEPFSVPKGHIPINNCLTAPLVFHGKSIGLLTVSNKEGGYDEADRQVLETIAESIAPVLQARLERKWGEEALRESESRYSALFTGITDAVFVHHITEDGRPGQFIDVNDVACEMLGYTRNELLGMEIGDVDAPESIVDVHRIVEDLKTGRDVLFDQTHVAKDGRRIPVEIHAQTFDYKGRLAILSTVRDMTERKRTEEALRKYEAIVATSGDLMSMLDTNYVYQAVNEAYLRAHKKEREEIVGHSVAELMGKSLFEEKVKPHLDQCFAGDEIHYQEWFDLPGSGQTFMDIAYYPFIADDGTVSAAVVHVRDITQTKQLEDQLRQAQKMEAIGTLAGGIAHDFNNLLMGIQGRTSLMLTDVRSHHPHFAHLTGIEDMVKRGAHLSKQLLGFARGGKYEVRATNLNILVGNTCEMFGRTRKEIKIHGKYQKDIWAVEVDQGQIEQVLLNLYVNAWQAMSEGGDLYLETRNIMLDKNFTKPFDMEPGNYVKLSVTDTGVGMDEATKHRVFEPFFSTKEIGGGTGLGLASAYGIIKNHGGIINVQSEPGQGTTIDIYLPASDKKVTVEEEPSIDMLEGTETVLLVDDEDMILDVGKEMLATLGYNVMLARSGKEAVGLYRKNEDKIDMVILDMIMPDMGGGEVYDKLKEINPHITVLLSSGYSIDGQASEILERGCNAFIQKPFNMKEMSGKIRKVLGRK